MLKSSPTGLQILDEGTDDSMGGLLDPVTLHVDAEGSALSFLINGHAVSQVSDADYAGGEVGFLVDIRQPRHSHSLRLSDHPRN